MSNLKRWFPILIGSGLAALLLFLIPTLLPTLAQGPGGMRGSMMRGGPYNGGGPGGMMGYIQGYTGTIPYGCGSNSMVGNYIFGGMMGQRVMWNSNSPFFTSEPLTLDEVTEAVTAYLAESGESNLIIREVMIFDNHAYAEVVEKDTDIGAMELLIDPLTKAVYPEMGPNMRWNLKYGMRSGSADKSDLPAPAEMPVGPEEAVQAAQIYLNTYLANANLEADDAAPFYGYYTLHVSREGKTVGMLSVNGYTRQIFLYTWHGKLLEMKGD